MPEHNRYSSKKFLTSIEESRIMVVYKGEEMKKLNPRQIRTLLLWMDMVFYAALFCTLVAGFYFFLTLGL